MPGNEFERPGVDPRPAPDHWPYHVPTPDEPPTEVVFHDASTFEPVHGTTRPERFRFLMALAVGVIAGAVAGGFWVAVALRPPPAPQPVPISLDTFPEELLGEKRNDISLRDGGFGPTVERLDAEFAEQLEDHRFAHGGDGATFGYGRLLELTVVNGLLSPALPRGSARNRDGKVTQTRRLISLRAGDVSCTFEPLPIRNPATALEEAGDLTSGGHTDCVLVDRERNLSLRLAQRHVERDADAIATSAAFRDELERLHTELAG